MQSHTHVMRSFRVALVIVALAALRAGVEEAAAQTRIATAKTIQCSLHRQSTGTWLKDGTAEATVKSSALTLRFESIDSDAGTARLRSGATGADVTVRFAEGYLHIMQAFRTGPLYTTTVFEAGSSRNKFKAVHSRHEYFTTPLAGATSSPEQYYGECEVLE
jgi:hypothetical protein